METKKIILIVVLVVVILFAIFGTIMGFFLTKNNKNNQDNNKEAEKYYITVDDMYCNLRESKRIVKIKATIEITDKNSYEKIQNKEFLIRDEVNKIIRNKKEEELQGSDGQEKLQLEIKNNLVSLFDDNKIDNVYFNDLIIQ